MHGDDKPSEKQGCVVAHRLLDRSHDVGVSAVKGQELQH